MMNNENENEELKICRSSSDDDSSNASDEEIVLLSSKPYKNYEERVQTNLLPPKSGIREIVELFTGMCIGIFIGKYILYYAYWPSAPVKNAPIATSSTGTHAASHTVTFQVLDHRTKKIPPLEKLILEDEIIGDVGWMLDFSIMDYPKAGTTFLMNYLSKSDEIYINQGEICYLNRRNPSKVVRMYYQPHVKYSVNDKGNRVLFGIKCPQELETEYGLQRYAKYFSRVKMIISVRHPVLWFESYYNFRAYHRWPILMPNNTDALIGASEVDYPYSQWNCSKNCPSGNQNVYSDRANFHWSLSRLGKTPMSTQEELDLLQHHNMSIEPSKSQVFLVENRQMLESHPSSKNFTSDLRNFLDLRSDLRPLKPWKPIAPEEKYPNREAAALRIDICEDEHRKIRELLVENGRKSADWIQQYFVKSPDVYLTSKEEFIKLLDDWKLDPCNERNKRRLRIDTPE